MTYVYSYLFPYRKVQHHPQRNYVCMAKSYYFYALATKTSIACGWTAQKLLASKSTYSVAHSQQVLYLPRNNLYCVGILSCLPYILGTSYSYMLID